LLRLSDLIVSPLSASTTPERGDHQHGERAEVADHQPAHRPGQQRPDLQAGATVEEVGEPAAHRPRRRWR